MKFETKFHLGQSVWHIRNIGKEIFVKCPSCVAGKVPLPDGQSLDCPRCKTKGCVAERYAHRWDVGQKMTVGQVRLCAGGVEKDDEEQYMTYQTGVGSGNVYDVEDLFVSEDEAQKECDKRNSEKGIEWACVNCNPDLKAVQYSGWNEWRYCTVHEQSCIHLNVEKAKEMIDERKKQKKALTA